MTPLEAIDGVRVHGGRVYIESGKLRLAAPPGLPAEIRQGVLEHKAAIMLALGEPHDAVVAAMLNELRPHLSLPVRRLPDDRLLQLFNWNLFVASQQAAAKVDAA